MLIAAIKISSRQGRLLPIAVFDVRWPCFAAQITSSVSNVASCERTLSPCRSIIRRAHRLFSKNTFMTPRLASLVPPKLPAHVHYHEFLKAAWSHLPNPIIAASHVVDAADVLALPQDQ